MSTIIHTVLCKLSFVNFFTLCWLVIYNLCLFSFISVWVTDSLQCCDMTLGTYKFTKWFIHYKSSNEEKCSEYIFWDQETLIYITLKCLHVIRSNLITINIIYLNVKFTVTNIQHCICYQIYFRPTSYVRVAQMWLMISKRVIKRRKKSKISGCLCWIIWYTGCLTLCGACDEHATFRSTNKISYERRTCHMRNFLSDQPKLGIPVMHLHKVESRCRSDGFLPSSQPTGYLLTFSAFSLSLAVFLPLLPSFTLSNVRLAWRFFVRTLLCNVTTGLNKPLPSLRLYPCG